jgi:3-hydroxyisobutyrate dehydrogenase
MKAGFIGLGAMGASMARNVAAAGLLSAVWNRSRSIALDLAEELHVEACESPADLGAQCGIVCVCVSADSDVLSVVEALIPGLKPNSIVVDFSTVSSETARQAAKMLAKYNAAFLDSPVSGGVEGARNGALAMMVGGDERDLERALPVMRTMGKRIVHMGPVGAGQATKAVNQIMAAGINQAVSEALAFGEFQGLPIDKVIDVVSSGAAGNWFLDHRGRTMTRGEFNPGFRVKLHHKDLLICQAMAGKSGFDSRVIDSILDDYDLLMQQGHGDEDISALYRLKRPR